MKTKAMWVASALLVAAAAPRGQGAEGPINVRTLRFYQPASGSTTIEGVMSVRLDAAQAGPFRVDLAVSDSGGLQLNHSSWQDNVATGRVVTAVESFSFEAAPGLYHVRVRIIPATGDSLEQTVDVSAYRSRPAVSDLLLANRVREPDSDSEPPREGEIRRAGLMLQTAPVPTLTQTAATLSWYAEAYPVAALSTQLTARVLAADGHQVIATPARNASFPAGGGLTRGSLDLSGLPAGTYRLQLQIGDSVAAEAPFAMASALSVTAASTAPGAPSGPADLFDAANEAQLDSMAAPLVDVARNPQQLRLYQTLTVDGKRRFLKQFWTDASMRIQGSVGRDQFYSFVATANQMFHESGVGQTQGWNTDRGRVFLRNGRWDEILQKPASSPVPFEVWRYTRGRIRYYVFYDRTGVGNYQLLVSNDLREVGERPTGWESVLGRNGAVDAYQFLGMDPNRIPIERSN